MVRLTLHKQQTTTPYPTERVEGSKTFNLPGDRKLSLTPAYDHNTKAFELEVAQVRLSVVSVGLNVCVCMCVVCRPCGLWMAGAKGAAYDPTTQRPFFLG